MSRHDLSEIDLRDGDLRIRLRRGARGTMAPRAGHSLPHAAAAGRTGAVGTAATPARRKAGQDAASESRAPRSAPSTPPEPRTPSPSSTSARGSSPTTVVGMIEAMKMFNEITGRLHRRHRRDPGREPAAGRVRPGAVPGRSHGLNPTVGSSWKLASNARPTALTTATAYVPTHPGCQSRRDRPAGHPRLPGPGHRGRWPSSARPTAAPPYLDLADEAICIGPAPAAESYLNIPRIISAAEIANVQAIHPGYGFLSENAALRRGLPVVQDRVHRPAARGDAPAGQQERGPQAGQEGRRARRARQRRPDRQRRRGASRWPTPIGYPVLIKAAAGGGGRGMRVARNDISLQAGLKAARQEAEKAFKDGSVYLEKYIEQPRHVEVQILGRPPRQRRPPLGARLLAAAPPSEAGRGIAGPEPAGRGARGHLRRPPSAWSRRPATRTPAPASSWSTSSNQFLLHRGQRPHPGGASGDRAGDRHRPGPASRSASPPASRWRSRQEDIVHRGVGHRVPHQRRGPRRRFPPLARHRDALAAARRPRRPPRHARGRPATACRPTTIR